MPVCDPLNPTAGAAVPVQYVPPPVTLYFVGGAGIVTVAVPVCTFPFTSVTVSVTELLPTLLELKFVWLRL